MGYKKFIRPSYKKFLGMGYEKFLRIAVNIFTGVSFERLLGISADSQESFPGISAKLLPGYVQLNVSVNEYIQQKIVQSD